MAIHSEDHEVYSLLKRFLDPAQKNPSVRKTLAGVTIFTLLGLICYFIYGLLPRQHTINISGGEIIGNRHFLAKVVQEEAAKNGVNLTIRPTYGSLEALRMVSEGRLDMAFIQGGMDKKFPDVEHVATLPPEMMHVLVKPQIESIYELKGKVINMGTKDGGTRMVVKKVLEFSGLQDGVDYVETNYSSEELINMHPGKLPDVIFTVSFAPSYVADYFIKDIGYRLVELPFPPSLALREGWVGDGNILAYTYSVNPPVPQKDIKTVGVYLHLVANHRTDPGAVVKILEAIYSPSVASKLHMEINEDIINSPSGFPISAGTIAYLKRNEPILSLNTLDEFQNWLGLIMTLLSGLVVVIKWFKGTDPHRAETLDNELRGYIAKAVAIERELAALAEGDRLNLRELQLIENKLTSLKTGALEKYPEYRTSDMAIMDSFLLIVSDTRNHVDALMARTNKQEQLHE